MRRPLAGFIALLAAAACSDASPEGSPRAQTPTTNPLAAYEPTNEQRTDALATLQTLFDALESGDADLLLSVVDPSVVMHFSETRDGRTTSGSATLDGLATRIRSSEVPLIERMWDPVVVVSGSLATVWTPYDFYAGTEFTHCGVDAASLLHDDDGWRIVGLSWTRQQPPACDLHPEGPPND